MKKIFLVFAAMIMLQLCANAMQTCECECPKPYDMNSKIRTIAGNVTCWNFISEKTTQSVLKKAIKKNIKSDNLKVKLDSYSAADMKNGIFKSLSIEGDNVIINNGIHLTHLDMKTVCDFNYIKHNGDVTLFMEDFPMAFNIKMNSLDLNKTMKSSKYQKMIEKLNETGRSYGGIKISSTKASIKSNKFYYVIGLSVPLIRTEQKLVITSDLAVRNNNIDFKNTQLITNTFRLDMKKLDFILNYLNPLKFSINVFDNKNAQIYVNNVVIHNNTIETQGVVVIPKDVD